MILCLESSLLGGHLSNEVPGLVTGVLHLAGCSQPVQVELVGNFLRDIAGCRVDLHNPLPHGDLDEIGFLSPLQNGFTGVMTASYRVAKMPRRKTANLSPLPEPAGLKNMLFFEWFNQQGQRVLIQSWNLQMRVSAPNWQMSTQEEASLLRQARARRKHFLLNERGTNRDRENALHAPGMPDPFEPQDTSGDPFKALETPEAKPKSAAASRLKRSQALAHELRRFEQLLAFDEKLTSRPAVAQLLSTVADLGAHLMHVLRQFSESKNAQWQFLIVDLEQSLPLFAAALNATDKMMGHAAPGTDLEWLAMVQASLLNIELRMRELLSLLR